MTTGRSQGRFKCQCRYRGAVCLKPRDTKLNGELHSLCEEHRRRANRNQRRLQQRQRLTRAKAASLKATSAASTLASRPLRRQENVYRIRSVPFEEWQVLLDDLAIDDSLFSEASFATPEIGNASAFSSLLDEWSRFQLFSPPPIVRSEQDAAKPFADLEPETHYLLPPRL